jgi:hypothetical protein
MSSRMTRNLPPATGRTVPADHRARNRECMRRLRQRRRRKRDWMRAYRKRHRTAPKRDARLIVALTQDERAAFVEAARGRPGAVLRRLIQEFNRTAASQAA